MAELKIIVSFHWRFRVSRDGSLKASKDVLGVQAALGFQERWAWVKEFFGVGFDVWGFRCYRARRDFGICLDHRSQQEM